MTRVAAILLPILFASSPVLADPGHGADGSGGSDRQQNHSIAAGPHELGDTGAAGNLYNYEPTEPGTATYLEIDSRLGRTYHTTSNPHGDAVNVISGSEPRSDSGRVN
jgi:hypothetical protein